ncbi:bacterio-opsin activator domain-containing protein [Haloferax larsenii]|uniref:PAS domain S-box-containing protein n=1 Tax=Haloferax larsenii TaxID=302484 RepID=A0A1H7KQD2_HALLR|nr:bacterio-opsin activator domain-containing protein [Haloferax larsenii]SEK88764.1 PAS domain S-box-containing protein [Haloferax larsenii]
MSIASPQARVFSVVGDDIRARVERELSSFDVEAVDSADAVERRLAEDAADCVVIDTDSPATVTAISETGVPVVVLVSPDADLSPGDALDAGAEDVVPVVESNLFDRLGARVASVVSWHDRHEEATDRITEDLKERAMDEAPVGITISDGSLPDHPLVYANDAFESMTGYTIEEALGRNCRYLQGDKTNQERVAELRRAIDAEESASVELLNYRRDGSTFWNRVDIAPLPGPDGSVTHYVGFQTDITERVRAEQAAERYAARVEEERARLQNLVDHIEGLLEDVTSALVRAETRAELETTVCEKIAASPSFEGAWIGDVDLSPKEIVPNEWAGAESATLSELRIDRDDDTDPTALAATTGEVRSQTASDGSLHAGVSLPFTNVIAVPLVHRDTMYGVLSVYATAAVDEYVQAVFGTLGRAVGAAIDAFESRRTLMSNEVLELELEITDSTQPLATLATSWGCRLEYEGSVPHDDGTVSLFVSTTPPTAGEDIDTEETSEFGAEGIVRVSQLPRGDDAGLYEIVLASDSLLHLVADASGRISDLEVDTDGTRLTVVVPDRALGRSLLDDLKTVARGVELRAVRDRAVPPQTQREFAASVGAELTDRQRTALQLAYLGGFFEWPHGVKGDELAEAMGVSRPTYHQHLRAAERKLVTRFFESEVL